MPPNEFPPAPGTPTDDAELPLAPRAAPAGGDRPPARRPGSAPGYIFAAPYIGPGQCGPMIFDNAGNLVWFQPVPAGEDAADFRTQQLPRQEPC